MVKQGRCVVIGGGIISDYKKTSEFVRAEDFIICADKGYLHCKAMGLNAELIVGDFDSSPCPEDAGCKVVKLNRDKDETDLFIAVSEGYRLGYRKFLLLGCLGGRFDHTYANLTLMAHWLENKAEIILKDEKNEIRLLEPGSHIFTKRKGYISFFAYSEKVEEFTLEGFKYPLRGFSLSNSCGLCVSNEMEEDKCTVSFSSGRLLTVFSVD